MFIFTVLNQDTNKKFQERADIADNNQRILLSITEFLPRICTLASEPMCNIFYHYQIIDLYLSFYQLNLHFINVPSSSSLMFA